MHIETERLIIRDFAPCDKDQLFKIAWQENVVKYMRDWSENNPKPDCFNRFIQWRQSQAESTDIYENKRYAVALKENNFMIGMVGMGLEDTLNEVEMAYFTDEDYQGRGYAAEALCALFDWCMKVSDILYLILTIDCANTASCAVAKKAGFELFEKRTPISHKQPNMVSDSYFYFRKYR